MRLLTILVEGDHDVVFVERSLRIHGGYVPYTKRLEEYPRPFGGGPTAFLLRSIRREAQEKLSLGEAKQIPRPVLDVALHESQRDTLALVYNTGGVDRDMSGFVGDLDFLLSRHSDFSSVAFLFCVDADAVGAVARASELQRFHGVSLGVSALSHAAWCDGATHRVGLYVFSAPGVDTGALEDHLLPMVASARPEESIAASSFLDGCATPRDRLRARPTARAKALITAAGQFEWPGHSMAKMIRYDALDSSHFRSSQLALDFARFVSLL